MNKALFKILLMLIAFGGLWYGLTQVIDNPKKDLLKVKGIDEERIGQMILNSMLQTEATVANKEIKHAVKEIKYRFVQQLESEYTYKITVIDKDEINAFALPGGNIVIFSGLINFCETPEELAAVIAHEMGHIENKHIIKRITREIGISVLSSIVFNGDAGMLGQISKLALSTSFDREEEREADQFAFKLMTKSGIKPVALADFFERLTEKQGDMAQELQFLSTHPVNKARIKEAQKFPLPNNFKTKPFTEINWDEVVATLE